MKIIRTKLDGCFIVKPKTFIDYRGAFLESYHKDRFLETTGLDIDFVQDNLSFSKKGVLRGLHFQAGEFAQAKLIRVVKGEILDVIVDLRKESPTYGEHVKLKMIEEENRSVFIPKGMAHGFLALSDDVIFAYKCDRYYTPKAEKGIAFNDSVLGIDWEYPKDDIILSEKDKNLPSFRSLQ
ncbi:dTDP-4-dehydrorhamnose 3,5-epimerase [Ulvibacterium sp.]|uniref:dTDP-4-dehydrorhamnose 3,5-epimerase n=1 Tax=Ulvibacterium sp. TaxID=2665914 RepID=UPI00260B0599|nr:dTDP-4-dehydrorhamnose 3,5-epimerase [Ulvibacterium sp.]